MDRNPWFRALLILAVAFLSVQLLMVVWRFGAHFAQALLIFFLAWTLSFYSYPGCQPARQSRPRWGVAPR